jgi:protoporphyrinogen oxidase
VRVGIIGGGAAGLAAAYELTKQGQYAEVFEQAPFLGGQASTFTVGGGQLERGYHHLFVSDTDIVDLIHEIGLGHRMAWLESKVGLYNSGKIWQFSTPLDLLRFTPLSMIQRLRVGFWTFVMQKTKDWRKFESVTARDWIIGHMGQKAYQVIWEPLLRGKFGEYYEQISMTWLWGKIYLRVASRGKSLQKERLGYPMGSFGEVFDTLAQRIEQQGGNVHIQSGVEQITVKDGAATGVRVRIGDGEAQPKDFDAVITTTPSYIFPGLVPTLPPDYLELLTTTNYLSAVLIILVLDRPLSNMYWLNIADRKLPFVGVIEHTNMIDKSIYGDNHIVYVTNYLSRQSDLYQMTQEELLAVYVPHLKKINPDFDKSWIIEDHYHKVDGAQPIIGLNYSQQIPDHRTPIKNLYLANTTQIYPEDRGTNYSVRMGRQVARMVMEDLK